MTDPIILYLYTYVIIDLLRDIGAVIYAYRLTKITGAFRGWVLVIVAIAVFTLQNFISIIETMVFFPAEQLTKLIQSIGIGSFVFSSILAMSLSLCLFFAMFELYKTFKKVTTNIKPREPLAPTLT